MNFNKIFKEINSFMGEYDFPFPDGGGKESLNKIQNEFEISFPDDLKYYIKNVVISDDFQFLKIGNELNLYGYSNMKSQQDGYSFNPVTHKKLEDWLDNWFIIADEGSDPIIVDLSDYNGSKIFRANHGLGEWKFYSIANSIPEFFLCSTALHYTFLKWGQFDAIDTSEGYILKKEPASWLFPKMKIWAGEYYKHWCGVFDNA